MSKQLDQEKRVAHKIKGKYSTEDNIETSLIFYHFGDLSKYLHKTVPYVGERNKTQRHYCIGKTSGDGGRGGFCWLLKNVYFTNR